MRPCCPQPGQLRQNPAPGRAQAEHSGVSAVPARTGATVPQREQRTQRCLHARHQGLPVALEITHGPCRPQIEQGTPNGHKQPVSPLKRVLLRNIPELSTELGPVVNAFDPWARDRGEYYSLQWKPRPGAESDDSFQTDAVATGASSAKSTGPNPN